MEVNGIVRNKIEAQIRIEISGGINSISISSINYLINYKSKLL